MRRQRQRFAERNVRVKAVTFDAEAEARQYVAQMRWPWPILIDRNQQLYHAFGMQHGSWWSIYGIPSLWKYLKLIFRGRMPGKPGRDWRQLGGNVLIDPQGIVRLRYISSNPHDRPSVSQLLNHVDDLPSRP